MPSSEMKAPERMDPQSLGDYLDVMSKAIFQTGISWKVVENKWPGTREVFHNFDAERVASMSLSEIDMIAQDTRVIRNRRKIEAIVSNAVKLVELAKQHGSFKSYLGCQAASRKRLPRCARSSSSLAIRGRTTCFTWLARRCPLTRSGWSREAGRVQQRLGAAPAHSLRLCSG